MIDSSKVRTRAVQIALGEVGVHEVGHNAGPRVVEYLKSANGSPGTPWCAAFCSWGMTQAAAEVGAKPPLRSLGAVDLFHQAKRAGMTVVLPGEDVSKVGPGWLWVRATSAKDADGARHGASVHGHVGMVVEPFAKGAATFATVEGNTNAAGAREGDGVLRKVHDVAHPYTVGWVDPWSVPLKLKAG